MKHEHGFALLSVLAVLLVACSFVTAQAPLAPGGGAAATPALTADQKVALYAAIHNLDKLDKQMSDLNQQFQTLQAQAKAQYETLQQQQVKLKADLELAQKKVFSDLKLDAAKYDLNLETLTVTVKPETAKDAAKPPEAVAKK